MDEIIIYANKDNQPKVAKVDAYESDHFGDADFENEDISLLEVHLKMDIDSDDDKDDTDA